MIVIKYLDKILNTEEGTYYACIYVPSFYDLPLYIGSYDGSI